MIWPGPRCSKVLAGREPEDRPKRRSAVAEGQAGARWVEVPPERLVRWVENFTLRHGPAVAEPGPEVVLLRASDGAAAACHPPFPPLPEAGEGQRDPGRQAELMAAHAAAARTVG